MSLPNAITREDFYLNKIANPSDDHELPDAITRQQHYLKAIAENAGGGGGGGDQPFIYSETERVVGEWVDGRPLYQKTIYIATITDGNNLITYSNYDISNVKDIIDIRGFFTRVTSDNLEVKVMIPNSAVSGGPYNAEVGDVKTDQFNLAVGSGWSSYTLKDCYLTFQYTKTTDTPGT